MPANSMVLVSWLVHPGSPIEADLHLRIIDISWSFDGFIKISCPMNNLLMSIDRQSGVLIGFDGSKEFLSCVMDVILQS